VAVGIPDVNAFGSGDDPASLRCQFLIIGERMQVMPRIASLPVASGILVASRHVEDFRYQSDPSSAYAIRAGIGTALTALIGTMYFREGADTMKPISLPGLAKTIPNTLE